jgi:hypothetical protein
MGSTLPATGMGTVPRNRGKLRQSVQPHATELGRSPTLNNVSSAVVRVMVDRDGELSPLHFAEGVADLEGLGYYVVSSPPQFLPPRRREVELIIEDGRELDRDRYVTDCALAFGTEAALGVITYISRGTDEDAMGVLRRFGVKGDLVREFIDGTDEVVTITIVPEDRVRVPESRLRTALEAALNCDVRIVMPTRQ